jgi:hypothetical protein
MIAVVHYEVAGAFGRFLGQRHKKMDSISWRGGQNQTVVVGFDLNDFQQGYDFVAFGQVQAFGDVEHRDLSCDLGLRCSCGLHC